MTTATTPNPCMEHRVALNLTEMCGNYSNTGYCIDSNSACLPSAENGGDWRCRCTYGYFTHNSSCVPVPSSLFEKMDMTLVSRLKTDRFVSLLQEASNNSVHFLKFDNDVQEVISNKSRCDIQTFPGFTCFVDSSGIEIRVNTVLDPTLYHVIVHVTLLIGQDEVEVKDILSILFEILAPHKNQTILLLDGTLKGTAVTKVDLKVNDSNPSLQGDVGFFNMDSTGLIQTNWTISLPSNLVSKLFTIFVYDDFFINIVVYKQFLHTSVVENNTGTVLFESEPRLSTTISQNGSYLEALPNGSIAVQQAFDYEITKEFSLELHSQYDELNFTTTITLDIQDVNDNAPYFPKQNFSFDESQSRLPAFVGIVSAVDVDSVGEHRYTINGDNRFSISSSGSVSMSDTNTNGEATVTVTDGTFQDQAFIYVKVYPNDVNSSNIEMNYTCSVTENRIVGTPVCSIFTDGYNTYSSGTQDNFTVDTNSGNITTSDILDREKQDSYKFSVIAKKTKDACDFAVIHVHVLVEDANDEIPAFEHSLYRGSVEESRSSGSFIVLEDPIKVTDKDLDSSFNYTISGNTFDINSEGEIFTRKSLDRETKPNYQLNLTVTDGIHSTSTKLEIKVTDTNDNYPQFSNLMFFEVLENATIGDELGQVNATDADEGRNAELIYTETGSALFEITTDGVLKVNRELDRETQDTETFSVTVCDQGKPTVLCNTTTVNVTIKDVNEEPVFKQSTVDSFYPIPENSSCTSISNLADFFEDGDVGVNKELDFRILSTHEEVFHVNSSGFLSCPKLDFESMHRLYELVIIATDRGTPPLSSSGTIVVVVEDVNDNAPIPSGDTHFTIVFNSAGCQHCSRLVALVTATDPDSGVNGELIFEETNNGDSKGLLEIDKDTGLIKTSATSIDQWSNGTYNYTVKISDQGSPSLGATTTLSFNVSVFMNSAIKFDEVFPNNTLMHNWTENKPFSSPFIDLRNFTNNETSTSVTFGIPNYNLADFYLNGSLLYVNTTTLSRKQGNESSSFDRESQKLYRFIILADLQFYSMLAELTINIIDINDNAPEFVLTKDRVLIIKEDAANDTALNVDIAAKDADEGENAWIAYRISNDENCNNFFQLKNIDTEWNLFLNGQLDYETMEHCIIKLVVYNPTDETLQSSIRIDVEVQDVNDNAPTFSQQVYNILLNETENDAQGEVLVNIPGFNVTDPDSRQFGTKGVRMSFVSDPECPLLVKEHKALNFVAMINQSSNLDYETKKMFNCTIVATDGGGISSRAVLDIELVDINDNAPEADDSITTEIPRDSNISHVIVSQINATDKDSRENGALKFEFLSTNGTYSYFQINSTNGEITLAKTLDTLLKFDAVELTVIVSDNGQPSLSTTVMVRINISDDNVRPFFAQPVYSVEVEENRQLQGLLLVVTANDIKKGGEVPCNCTYSINGSPDDNSSNIYTISEYGQVIITGSGYDRESQPFVLLTVTAEDEEGKDTSTLINITVLDKNDNDPKFLTGFQFEVYQEARVGTSIGTVTAVDDDLGVYAVTLYSIIKQTNGSSFTEDVFTISEITGELRSSASLDIGALKDFTEYVTVEAMDKNDTKRTNRVTVTVTIKFNDTNQHPPNITYNTRAFVQSVAIKENAHVLALTATDPDEGEDGEVDLSIVKGNAFNMFHINSSGFIVIRKTVRMIGNHPINLTVQAMDRGVNPKSSSITLALTLEGEKDPTQTVDAMRQFETYTWSLVGVTCFLILTTAFGVIGWCRSRMNPPKPTTRNNFANAYGLKHNVSYGFLDQVQLRGAPDPGQNWSTTDEFARPRVRYPQEEFDQRQSYRLDLFENRPKTPPPLPKPRERGAPFIPREDYE